MIASIGTSKVSGVRTVAPRTLVARANKAEDFKQQVQGTVENLKDAATTKAQEYQEQANTPSSSFTADAKDSLEPRVADLRNNQLRRGLTDKEEIQAFDGPLPELVNGRLAMLGFTACMAAEYVSHRGLWEQIRTAPASIALTFAIFGIASLIPIMRGTDMFPPEEKEGLGKSGFTVTNELINGRAAMLGFAIILAYETIMGHPLFV